jgi:hypothetical protein
MMPMEILLLVTTLIVIYPQGLGGIVWFFFKIIWQFNERGGRISG